MFKKAFFLVIFIELQFTLLITMSFGNDFLNTRDSTKTVQINSTKRSKTPPEKKDSLLYTKIKTRLSKNRIGKNIYSLLFKDVYNSNTKSQISAIDVNPFDIYEGKIIRSIRIKRLNVFGTSVYDTTRYAKNSFEIFANKLHISTKENIINNSFVMFDVGDLVNPAILRENERFLRRQPFLHDARIYVEPDLTKPNFIDIQIVTQDTWSLTPIIEFSNTQHFGIILDHNNFRGNTHQIKTGYRHNAKAIKQKNEVFSTYTIPYIKKTLITAEANFQYLEIERSLGLKVFRPFITPQIKYAGSAEISIKNLTYFDKPRGIDSVFHFPVNYNLSDFWLGRAFPLFFGDSKQKERTRIVIAARARKITFTKRPTLTNDTNQTFQNRQTYLFSVGYSNRYYKRDVLIYGFGRTEDVPIGSLIAAIGGKEKAELGNRNYFGVKLAHGNYLKNNSGYLYSLINVGSFIKQNSLQQGVFSFESNYFSPLINWNTNKTRLLAGINYTRGINRFNTVNERLSISNEGIRGVNSDSLKGVKKIVFNFEAVLFSRANIAGFRIAPYAFADLGLINFKEKTFFNGPLYSGFGFGFRFRNENLTFNTFQVRFGIYPNIPNINAYRFAFSGEQKLTFRDFDISAPEEIRFR